MHACKIKNGVLCNGQQPSSAMNSQGKFEAMKMLSGHRVPCCDTHQFRPKIILKPPC